MKLTYSDQFKSPCVVIEAGDAYDECMRYITDNNAIWFDGEEDCCVVEFNVGERRVGPELYTKESLRRSFAESADRFVIDTANSPIDFDLLLSILYSLSAYRTITYDQASDVWPRVYDLYRQLSVATGKDPEPLPLGSDGDRLLVHPTEKLPDFTDQETVSRMRKWVSDPQVRSHFQWVTDVCGYRQHLRFVRYRNEHWADYEGTFHEFILEYADKLERGEMV